MSPFSRACGKSGCSVDGFLTPRRIGHIPGVEGNSLHPALQWVAAKEEHNLPRILVVDDDPLVRGLLVRCLHVCGYDTEESPDGSHAIDRLENQTGFDVVVTDYSMPGATGLDVIRAAHRVDPTLPSIVVTAFHDMDLA